MSYDLTAGKWNFLPVGGIQAPLLFVGPTQVNFQMPPGVVPGEAVAAELRRPDGSSLLTTLNVPVAQPGIFSVSSNGRGPGAVINENGRQNWIDNPARRGSVITLYATGQGETEPQLGAGEPAPASGVPLIRSRLQPVVRIGDRLAEVQFSGLAPGYVGLWQINVQIPTDVVPGPAVPVTIAMGEQVSNTVTLTVE